MPSTAQSLGERIRCRARPREHSRQFEDPQWADDLQALSQTLSQRTIQGQIDSYRNLFGLDRIVDADWRPSVTEAHEKAWFAMWKGIGSLHQSAVECRLPCTPTWANLEVESVIYDFQVERAHTESWTPQATARAAQASDNLYQYRGPAPYLCWPAEFHTPDFSEGSDSIGVRLRS